ncbi:MAG: folylpolyglutamate synthase/dihydrofolate synthase family protein [Hyphomonadaceae bacterium]
MSHDTALARFEALFGPEFGHGRPFDLAPLRAALAALGSPQRKLAPIVHVAGTNGKGSTIAFLRAIAEAAGLRVHVFSKPHLLSLRERFRIAGALINDDALCSAAARVHAAQANLSQFEAQIAAAFLLFSETPADLVLLETGFGGRDDATNVIAAPALSLLMPIDFDHQDILGRTRQEIAAHKAGIIKPGAPAIAARQHEDAAAVLVAAADRAGAPLLLGGRDWDVYARGGRLLVQTETRLLDLPPPALFGPHQVENAGLAAMAALALGDARIHEETIAAGLRHAHWPARLHPIVRGPLAERVRLAGGELWIDGGHNPHAAHALAAALTELNRRASRPTIAIVALRTRKDGESFVAALAPALTALITTTITGDSCVAPEALAKAASGVRAETAPDLEAALDAALRTPGARIVICGSLKIAGAALASAGFTPQ